MGKELFNEILENRIQENNIDYKLLLDYLDGTQLEDIMFAQCQDKDVKEYVYEVIEKYMDLGIKPVAVIVNQYTYERMGEVRALYMEEVYEDAADVNSIEIQVIVNDDTRNRLYVKPTKKAVTPSSEGDPIF